jgi:hypothetical protein
MAHKRGVIAYWCTGWSRASAGKGLKRKARTPVAIAVVLARTGGGLEVKSPVLTERQHAPKYKMIIAGIQWLEMHLSFDKKSVH